MTILTTLRSTETRLRFWRGVCGCHAGALAVLVALGWVVARFARGAELTTASALRSAALVVGAGIAAKLAAVLASRAFYAADAALFARRTGRTTTDERARA